MPRAACAQLGGEPQLPARKRGEQRFLCAVSTAELQKVGGEHKRTELPARPAADFVQLARCDEKQVARKPGILPVSDCQADLARQDADDLELGMPVVRDYVAVLRAGHGVDLEWEFLGAMGAFFQAGSVHFAGSFLNM